MKDVKHLVTVLLLLVSGACFAAGKTIYAREDLVTTAGVSTQLLAHSIPNARCDLTAPGVAGETLEVFSDSDGTIRLWLQLDRGHAAAEMALDCTAEDGTREHRSIRVRPGIAPAPVSRKRALRPALTGDPMRVSQKDLRARGFPRRPDNSDAHEMQRWLEEVSSPAAIVSPRRIAGRMVNRQTITIDESTNWSGFMLEPNDGAQFVRVGGTWLVPTVSRAPRPDGPSGNQYSSAWVGLDDGPGIFQAGTQHNVMRFLWWEVTVYNAWIEVFPGPVTVVPDVEVGPGDSMMVRIMAVNRAGDLDPTGDFMGFEIHNHTRKQYLIGDAFAKFAGFQGNRAEWIVERQTPAASDGSYLPLQPMPDYGSMDITSVFAYDSTGRKHDLYTDTNTLHKFYLLDYDVADEGVVTSAIQRLSRTSMRFQWINPAP